jgi:ankyrin repeat protein
LPAQRRQRCPILPTVPGFNLRDVSSLGAAVLLNATGDIEGLVRAGCDVNYDGAYNVRTSTQCESPLLTRLGIDCTREVKESGYTALAIALLIGSTPTLKKLVSLPGIDLNSKTADINPAVYDAAWAGNLEALVILGEAGADLNAGSSENGVNPLSIAAYRNEKEIVRYLLSKGVNVDQEDNNGGTAVFLAAEAGNHEIMKLLQAEGADLDAVGTGNRVSALGVAAQNGHTDVVKYLISKGVDLNKKGLDGDNAVFMAALAGKFDVVQALAAAGADLNLHGTARARWLPLEAAIIARNTEIAVFLIKNGANINLRDADGDTFAFLAAYLGDVEVVAALAEAGADLDTAGVTGPMVSPVAAAAARGNVEVVEFLVSRGVDLSARDNNGKTAEDLAEEAGYTDIAKLLNTDPK